MPKITMTVAEVRAKSTKGPPKLTCRCCKSPIAADAPDVVWIGFDDIGGPHLDEHELCDMVDRKMREPEAKAALVAFFDATGVPAEHRGRAEAVLSVLLANHNVGVPLRY